MWISWNVSWFILQKNDYLSYASRDINLFTFASVKGPLMISYYKAKIKHTKKA